MCGRCGACSGGVRFLCACNGGCIGFVEVFDAVVLLGKQLQIARRLIGLQMAALCYWEMPVQFAKRLMTVGSRWCCVAGQVK